MWEVTVYDDPIRRFGMAAMHAKMAIQLGHRTSEKTVVLPLVFSHVFDDSDTSTNLWSDLDHHEGHHHMLSKYMESVSSSGG